MSNRKSCEGDGLPDLETLCRLCLEPHSGSVNIFDSGELSIPVRIMACTALEVQPTDGLPKLICDNCRFQLEKSYYFRKNCQLADAKLRKHIRLINAGKKSRMFLRSSDGDEDDDDGKLMLEDSIAFIQREEEKIEKEEEDKRLKWQAEQLEIFRKEETQKLFEDFGNFVSSRKTCEKPAPAIKEKSEYVANECSPPKFETLLPRPATKPENTYTRRPKKRKIAQKADESVTEADNVNEITSSEQIPHDREQIYIYDDDVPANTDGAIQTYLLYEKDEVGGNNHIIEIEGDQLDEFDELERNDDDGDTGTEGDLNINLNEEEDEESESYVFTGKYEELDGRDEDDRPDSENFVESYQIEENGEIQYVKEEGSVDALSTSADQMHIEDCIDMPVAKSKSKRKAADTDPCYIPEKQKKLISTSPIVSKVSTEDLKIFKCSECPQSFTREKSLIRHRSAHRKGREYSCDFCDKWFSCKSSLDRHIRIHTGEKPYTCDECGKSYMQKEVLKRHIVIHSGQRPHPCPHCPRSFVQKLMLTQHINATHLEVPKIQKHACHMCSKTFHHASGLSRHLITHSGTKFHCSSCGRSFNDKSSIRRHVLAVHSKYDKTVIEVEKFSPKGESSNTSIEFVS